MILLFAISCEDEKSGFEDDTSIGWIEATTASSTTGITDTSADVFIEVTTPIFNAFSFSYKITPVSGDFTRYIQSSTGTFKVVPGKSRVFAINIALVNMEALRDTETVFDVQLVSSTDSATTIGLSDGSINTTQRITIPCNEPDNVEALLDFDPNYLLGDFTLSDDSTSGVIPLFGPGQDVTIFEGNIPTERIFEAVYYAGTNFARLVTVTLEIVDDEVGGKTVVLKESVVGLVACAAGQDISVNTYEIDADDADQDDIEYTQYSICGGGPSVFAINFFETTGGCGPAPQFSTFTLTKI
jgi:hypothetical protein